ncbi:unnamed protein product [Leptidea sinapis]|uniref:Protein lin-37 homolog n=1 Tax=Leptidea sinapis TaxID=189913 RepID=A0A5E4QS51_9NEOP|nr:unnamed protein product [Leptidea sinapis]
MPRRRRFTPLRYRTRTTSHQQNNEDEEEIKKGKGVSEARCRLMGALMEIVEPTAEESDGSDDDYTPVRKERKLQSAGSADDVKLLGKAQSYVLKLFDRSVDLSQFTEDTPLYPICRAWMANNPKADYKACMEMKEEEPLPGAVELPGPEGPPISRIPQLLPAQSNRRKENIDFNCEEELSKEQLLSWHMGRWCSVRHAWLEQAANVHARYAAAHKVLESMNASAV